MVKSELHKNIDDAYDLYDTLYGKRKLYSCIFTSVASEKTTFTVADITNDEEISKNIVIFRNKVGFVSGNKTNPLDNIYTYTDRDLLKSKSPKPIKSDKMSITALMPLGHQEFITMVFYKNKDDEETISFLTDILAKF